MKIIKKLMMTMLAVLMVFSLAACSSGDNGNPPTATKLNAPTASISDTTLSWETVTNASGYEVDIDGTIAATNLTATTYSLASLTDAKTYTIKVKALGDGENYSNSDWSISVSYTIEETATTLTKAEQLEEIKRVINAINTSRETESAAAPVAQKMTTRKIVATSSETMTEDEINEILESDGLDGLMEDASDTAPNMEQSCWVGYEFISQILFTAVDELGENALDNVYAVEVIDEEQLVAIPFPSSIDVKGIDRNGKVLALAKAGAFSGVDNINSYDYSFSAYHNGDDDYGFEMYNFSSVGENAYLGTYFSFDKKTNHTVTIYIYPNDFYMYYVGNLAIPSSSMTVAVKTAIREKLDGIYDNYFNETTGTVVSFPEKPSEILDTYTKDGIVKQLVINLVF